MKKFITLFLCVGFFVNVLQAQEEISKPAKSTKIVSEYKVSGEVFPVNNILLIETNRGMTTSPIVPMDIKVSGTIQPMKINNNIEAIPNIPHEVLTDYSDWILTDTLSINTYLAGGQNAGVKLNIHTRKFELILPTRELNEAAISAVKKVPNWIKDKFKYTLSKLNNFRMNELAEVVNNAEAKYIDEIAFAIAYSSSTFLSSNYCFPQLFLENAELIYKHDEDLNYVEVVDYGVPGEDEDFYTTVKYWTVDSLRGKIQVEVPRDIYYMYIVHPKISDELPSYINPNKSEIPYKSNITAPPTGVFWRDYLYTHTEERVDTTGVMYPILKDSMALCDVLWNDNKDSSNQAVRYITAWIRSVMKFTSKQERPHQPVRIYDLHIGRCGEHEDLTVAVARACLIPCRTISATSIDHVWNEFWDEQWEQWEPVNRSYKRDLAYITWDTLGAVSARLSSGSHEYVTDRYNDKQNSTHTLTAVDANGNIIDGAVFKIYSNRFVQGDNYIVFDTYGITDNNGSCELILGKDKLFYAQLITKYGTNPPESNRVLRLTDGYSTVGQKLAYSIPAPNAIPNRLNPVSIPADNEDDFMVRVKFNVKAHEINWKIQTNDLAGETIYAKSNAERNISFLIADESNYKNFNNKKTFDAYKTSGQSDEIVFDVPFKNWHLFLNSELVNNLQLVNATFALYRHPAVSVKENNFVNSTDAYPNPFSTYTTINYTIEKSENVKIEIYNSLGNKISEIINEFQLAGEHQAIFNADDLSAGVYYYTISHGKTIINGQLLLNK